MDTNNVLNIISFGCLFLLGISTRMTEVLFAIQTGSCNKGFAFDWTMPLAQPLRVTTPPLLAPFPSNEYMYLA